MPRTEVVHFAEDDGSPPVLDWLAGLPSKVQDKAIARVELLREHGHELRRPAADYLGDDIYELRVSYRRVQYRILYFFHEHRAVLCHGLIKEREVPKGEIAAAMRRRDEFLCDPTRHTFQAEVNDG
jgi:phage-related protein